MKSLVPFPDVLKMMSDQLRMDPASGRCPARAAAGRVQRDPGPARPSAAGGQAAERPAADHQGHGEHSGRASPGRRGRLGSPAPATGGARAASPVSHTVPPPQQIITIEPTQPDQVYVPAYNPSVVYGSWPYPSNPPAYYPPPAASYPVAGALLTGMAFAGGVALVGSAWGWANPSWGNGDINVNRVNNINRSGTWQHNVEHRQGVAYRGDNVRNQYQPDRGSRTAAREEFRGRTQQAERGGGSAFGGERGGNRAAGDRVGGDRVGGNRGLGVIAWAVIVGAVRGWGSWRARRRQPARRPQRTRHDPGAAGDR